MFLIGGCVPVVIAVVGFPVVKCYEWMVAIRSCIVFGIITFVCHNAILLCHCPTDVNVINWVDKFHRLV